MFWLSTQFDVVFPFDVTLSAGLLVLAQITPLPAVPLLNKPDDVLIEKVTGNSVYVPLTLKLTVCPGFGVKGIEMNCFLFTRKIRVAPIVSPGQLSPKTNE